MNELEIKYSKVKKYTKIVQISRFNKLRVERQIYYPECRNRVK